MYKKPLNLDLCGVSGRRKQMEGFASHVCESFVQLAKRRHSRKPLNWEDVAAVGHARQGKSWRGKGGGGVEDDRMK